VRRGHHGKVDANQQAIVRALRAVGCSVQSIASIGSGCPDLAVGKNGRTYLLEVKRPGRVCTVAECKWIAAWKGHVDIVQTVEDALRVVNA